MLKNSKVNHKAELKRLRLPNAGIFLKRGKLVVKPQKRKFGGKIAPTTANALCL
jgi:hypothetical protein